MSDKGATVPSMEKTPSVAISRKRESLLSFSFASRSAMSLCLYLQKTITIVLCVLTNEENKTQEIVSIIL